MKRLFLCLLIALVIGAGSPVHALLGVQDDQNLGYRGVSTDTVSIPATGKTNIGQYVPTSAVGFSIYVFGSDCILNTQSNLASGAIFVGNKVASGSFQTWTGKQNGYPISDMYICPNTTSAATATIVAW